METNIISTDEIEEILYNKATFNRFIRRTNQFSKTNINDYLEALNKYMEYLIENGNNISKNVFDSINYINAYFNYNKSYSYEEYLDKTERIITLNTLNDILKNKSTFKKFLNYEKNLDFFDNLSIQQYIYALDNMVKYYHNNNIGLPNKYYKRYLLIKKTYFDLTPPKIAKPRKLTLDDIDGYVPDSDVNIKLKESVLKGLDLNEDKLLLARQIYINLCKVLKYDTSFPYLSSYNNTEQANDIYNRDINDITLKNNDIICKSWAEIYAKVLIDIGLNAKVVGTNHRHVTFQYGDLLIEADATNVIKDEADNYMNDLTRVKLDLTPTGFTSFDDDNRFYRLLANVDKRIENIGENVIKKKLQIIDYYNSVTEQIVNISLDEKIDFLNKMANSSNLVGLEYLTYLKSLIKTILSDIKEKIDINYIIDNEYMVGLLLTISKNRNLSYYIFYKKSDWHKYNKSQIQDAMENGIISTLFSDTKIPGILKEDQHERTR